MKKLCFTLTLLVGLLLPLAPRAQAQTEVSLNFFYDNLSTEGAWIDVGDYGYCFQPNVAVSDTNWRPYTDGYWTYTDAGWTWVSYEDFGWATYHYGRWTELEDYGWVWVPGTEWAGAWVSWRTGGDYVGWAPLPPAREAVYEGRAITGQVDVEFNIGPTFYNFVDIRYIGAPVLRQRLIAPSRNITIINNTVNVTNITRNNTTVYNYGPNFDRVNSYAETPIRRMRLQRETTVASLNLQAGGRRNLNQVNGDQLRVIAPVIQKSQQKIAPKQVKATVKAPKIRDGWKDVPNREQLQARMKSENPKNVPPPTVPQQKGRKAQAAANEQNGAQPAGNENAAAAAPANDNAANQNNEQTAREARRAKAQERNANDANAGEAEKAQRAAKADEAKKADNAQADQREARKEARAERAQAADQAQGDEQQQAARKAQRAENQDRTTSDEQSSTQGAERRAARKAKRAEAQDQADRSTARPDAQDNQPAAESGQQDQAQQQQRAERRKDRQQQNAERPPNADQPEQSAPRRAGRAAQPDEAPRASQQPDQAQPHPRQQQEQAAPAERAQQREQRQNARAQRKAKQKGQPDSTPEQPQP